MTGHSAPRHFELAVVTNGEGQGVVAVDRRVDLGGTPAELTAEVLAKLDAVLPPIWSGANPIDIAGDADATRYAAALDVLLKDKANDGVLVMNVQTAVASPGEIAATVAQLATAHRKTVAKPVLSVWVGADEATAKIFSDAAIPNFATEADAVRGFMHLVHHGEASHALAAVPPSLPSEFVADVGAGRSVVRAALADGRRWLDPFEIERLFAAYQIPIAPTLAAADAEQAAAQAEIFLARGQSVAVKILSRDIVHKSDVGGVALNLPDTNAVRSAVAEILANARAKRPDARIDGVMIQPMITRWKARELILGIADDPTFGPVIVFGRGGTAVEVINDKALALPPLDLNLARDLIARTRVARRLAAYRDVPAVKQDEIPLVLVKLAQLAADIPEIRELDINPLLADHAGVLALDARVAVAPIERRFAGPGNSRFSVRPYPTEWQRELTLRNGRRIQVRPIRPEDEPVILEFLQHINADDLRLRFFGPMKVFTHAFIARLTQLDYARAMAFLAFDDAGELIGVVRIHSDSAYESGEYAILLRSDRKGQGLGWTLMQYLIEYARTEGLQRIAGQVLRENTAMLQMCRELGFVMSSDPTDPGVQIVTLALRS